MTASAEPDRHDRVWNHRFAVLQQHLADGGEIDIPESFITADGFRLGRWLFRQRLAHRHGGLRPARFAALDAVGVDWQERPPGPRPTPRAEDSHRAAHRPAARHDQRWAETLDVLHAHLAQGGSMTPPESYVASGGVRLGRWLYRQRLLNRKGVLLPDRFAALDALGMNWTGLHLPAAA